VSPDDDFVMASLNAVARSVLESQNRLLERAENNRKELELVKSQQQQVLHSLAEVDVAIKQGSIEPEPAAQALRELSEKGERILRYIASLLHEAEEIRNESRQLYAVSSDLKKEAEAALKL
jgi:hypothetical protein